MDTKSLKQLVKKTSELIEAIEEYEDKEDVTTNRFMDIAAEIEETENPHTERLKQLRAEVREIAIDLAADLLDFELQHEREIEGRRLRLIERGRMQYGWPISGYITASGLETSGIIQWDPNDFVTSG